MTSIYLFDVQRCEAVAADYRARAAGELAMADQHDGFADAGGGRKRVATHRVIADASRAAAAHHTEMADEMADLASRLKALLADMADRN